MIRAKQRDAYQRLLRLGWTGGNQGGDVHSFSWGRRMDRRGGEIKERVAGACCSPFMKGWRGEETGKGGGWAKWTESQKRSGKREVKWRVMEEQGRQKSKRLSEASLWLLLL